MTRHGLEPRSNDDYKEALEISRKLKNLSFNNTTKVVRDKCKRSVPKPSKAHSIRIPKPLKGNDTKSNETQTKQRSHISEQRSLDNESSFEMPNHNYNNAPSSNLDDDYYDGDVSDYVKGEDAYYTDDYGCEDNDSDTDYGPNESESDYPESSTDCDSSARVGGRRK